LALRKVNNIRWGVILNYIALVVNIIISIIYTPFMLNLLGQEEHGIWTTVSAIMSWLSLLSLGIGSSFIKFFAKYKKEKREDLMAGLNGLFIIIFVIIGIVALFCGIVMANNLHLLFDSGLTPDQYGTAKILSIIITVDMAVGFPASVFSAIIGANEKFVFSAVLGLIQNLCSPFLNLMVLYSGYGSIGLVTVTVCLDFIMYSVKVMYCFTKLKIKVKFRGAEKGILKSIFSFTIFITINMLISRLNATVDNVLLTRYISPAAASIYAIGGALNHYYTAFSSPVTSVFGPRVYRTVAENEDDKSELRKKLSELFTKLGRIKFMVMGLLMTGIIFFGQAFIHFWAGDSYNDSYWVALLLVVSGTFAAIQVIAPDVQRALNKHWVRTVVYAIQTVLNIVVTILLIPKYGIVGAVIGTASMEILAQIFWNIYYSRALYLNIWDFWKNILRVTLGMLIPAAVGTVILIFVPMKEYSIFVMLGLIVAYTIIYCLSLWFISMNAYEKDLLTGKIRRAFKKIKALFKKKEDVKETKELADDPIEEEDETLVEIVVAEKVIAAESSDPNFKGNNNFIEQQGMIGLRQEALTEDAKTQTGENGQIENADEKVE